MVTTDARASAPRPTHALVKKPARSRVDCPSIINRKAASECLRWQRAVRDLNGNVDHLKRLLGIIYVRCDGLTHSGVLMKSPDRSACDQFDRVVVLERRA